MDSTASLPGLIFFLETSHNIPVINPSSLHLKNLIFRGVTAFFAKTIHFSKPLGLLRYISSPPTWEYLLIVRENLDIELILHSVPVGCSKTLYRLYTTPLLQKAYIRNSTHWIAPPCHSPPFFAEAKTGNWQRFLLLFTFNRFHCFNGMHNLFVPGNLCQAFFAEIFLKSPRWSKWSNSTTQGEQPILVAVWYADRFLFFRLAPFYLSG